MSFDLRRASALLLLATVSCGVGAPEGATSSVRPSEPELATASASVALPTADEAMARARREHARDTGPLALPAKLSRVVASRDTACRGGDDAACVDLAWAVRNLEVGRDPARLAHQLLEGACARGGARACAEAAIARLNGRGVAPERVSAAAQLEASCRAGIVDACGELGLAKVLGRRLSYDRAGGFELLLRACEGGGFRACHALETRPWVRPYAKDLAAPAAPAPPAHAATAALEACAAGRLEACSSLPVLAPYPPELGSALCASGFETACSRPAPCSPAQIWLCDASDAGPLAAMCSEGLGAACLKSVDARVLRGGCAAGTAAACRRWLALAPAEERSACAEEACGAGDTASCAALEVEAGRSTPEALDKLVRACPETEPADDAELSPAACVAAARTFRVGLGAPPDKAWALELYRRACWGRGRFAHDEACAGFGDMLRDGEGVVADRERARATYRSWISACERDCAVAEARLRTLSTGGAE